MSKILQVIRTNCVGIDVGSNEVMVGYPDQAVKRFGTVTSEFSRLQLDLKASGIKSVALESTGVYGIVLHDMLREAGFEVYLVHPKYTKSRSGKKTDVKDSQWIQQLHSVDLLEPSFVPSGSTLEMRSYLRQRERHIEDKSKQVNRMRKALIQMNLRLDTVLSQVHGVSGLKMIKAILAGERDKYKLLELCASRIKENKSEQLLEALEGFYQPQHLFALEQALERYQFIEKQILSCDKKLEALLEQITQEMETPQELPKTKKIRHNRPEIAKLQIFMLQLYQGKDLTVLPGFTNYTLLQLQGELGPDLSAFPTKKHFTSWLGLAPGQNRSGKGSKRVKHKARTAAGQIFRVIAQSLLNSKNNALGAFGRRIRSRKGPKIAIKALARKLAELYYMAATKGIEYVEQGVKQYKQKLKSQQIKRLEKQAQAHGFQLIKEIERE